MNQFFKRSRIFISIGSILWGVVGCDPIPSKTLTSDQKLADMMWLYSQFDENYAPLDYKLNRFGLNYEKLKTDYMQAAVNTSENDEFYHVMEQFVAEFRDAHTTSSLSDGGYPNRVKIAYLGFSGKRKGDSFVVTEILPTSKGDKSHFPIKVDDEIVTVNGKPLAEMIRSEFTKLQDLGNNDSNLTFHMNRLFTRVSTSNYLPVDRDIILGVKKLKKKLQTDSEGDAANKESAADTLMADNFEVKEVTLPWVVKDLFDFRREQKIAKDKGVKASKESPSDTLTNLGSTHTSADVFALKDQEGGGALFFGLRGFDGSIQRLSSAFTQNNLSQAGYEFLDSFYFPNQVESWTSDVQVGPDGALNFADVTPLSQFQKVRKIPSKARFVTSEQATFPAYVTSEDMGHGEKRLVATLYLNTFSPSASASAVVKEFKETLDALQFYGVQDLVIDMINNGGGSLNLGMKLAQALSNTKVEMPAIQFIASQSWMNQFEGLSRDAASDAERELASRIYKDLQDINRENDRRASGEKKTRLSNPYNLDQALLPFDLEPNTSLNSKFRVVVLVNEMCASMCDIFSGIVQDNHLATVVGARTMGAGGNVVNHYEAPNSHLMVRQTESLIVRRVVKADGEVVLGSYIENLGITPDVEMDVSSTSNSKYASVRIKAIEALKAMTESVAKK